MSIITTRSTRELIEQSDIEQIWAALGGGKLKNRRGVAFWRPSADGYNVQLYPKSNSWRDFAHNEGGGILALIEQAHSCQRRDAIRWLHEYHGSSWRDSPVNLAQRAEAGQQRFDALLQGQLRLKERQRLIDERNVYWDCARVAEVHADDGNADWAALVASASLEHHRATACEGELQQLEATI